MSLTVSALHGLLTLVVGTVTAVAYAIGWLTMSTMFEFGPLLVSDYFWSKTRRRLGVSQVDPAYLEVLAGLLCTLVYTMYTISLLVKTNGWHALKLLTGEVSWGLSSGRARRSRLTSKLRTYSLTVLCIVILALILHEAVQRPVEQSLPMLYGKWGPTSARVHTASVARSKSAIRPIFDGMLPYPSSAAVEQMALSSSLTWHLPVCQPDDLQILWQQQLQCGPDELCQPDMSFTTPVKKVQHPFSLATHSLHNVMTQKGSHCTSTPNSNAVDLAGSTTETATSIVIPQLQDNVVSRHVALASSTLCYAMTLLTVVNEVHMCNTDQETSAMSSSLLAASSHTVSTARRLGANEPSDFTMQQAHPVVLPPLLPTKEKSHIQRCGAASLGMYSYSSHPEQHSSALGPVQSILRPPSMQLSSAEPDGIRTKQVQPARLPTQPHPICFDNRSLEFPPVANIDHSQLQATRNAAVAQTISKSPLGGNTHLSSPLLKEGMPHSLLKGLCAGTLICIVLGVSLLMIWNKMGFAHESPNQRLPVRLTKKVAESKQAPLESQGSVIKTRVSVSPATWETPLEVRKPLQGAESIVPKSPITTSAAASDNEPTHASPAALAAVGDSASKIGFQAAALSGTRSAGSHLSEQSAAAAAVPATTHEAIPEATTTAAVDSSTTGALPEDSAAGTIRDTAAGGAGATNTAALAIPAHMDTFADGAADMPAAEPLPEDSTAAMPDSLIGDQVAPDTTSAALTDTVAGSGPPDITASGADLGDVAVMAPAAAAGGSGGLQAANGSGSLQATDASTMKEDAHSAGAQPSPGTMHEALNQSVPSHLQAVWMKTLTQPSPCTLNEATTSAGAVKAASIGNRMQAGSSSVEAGGSSFPTADATADATAGIPVNTANAAIRQQPSVDRVGHDAHALVSSSSQSSVQGAALAATEAADDHAVQVDSHVAATTHVAETTPARKTTSPVLRGRSSQSSRTRLANAEMAIGKPKMRQGMWSRLLCCGCPATK